MSDPIKTGWYVRFEPMEQDKIASTAPVERPVRRRFTKEEKLRIVRLADACTVHGQLGALLRREGIYTSQLHSFRRQFAEGRLVSNSKADRKLSDMLAKNGRLRLALENATHKLEQAELIIDVQKKISRLLEISDLTHQYGHNNEISWNKE